MKPVDIYSELRKDVFGQDEALRFISVAIFKHTVGEKFGNLFLIGNSGTGKTTVMKSIEKLYRTNPYFEKFQVVVRLNANSLLDDDETGYKMRKLFKTLDEKARSILGYNIDAETLQNFISHSTVCIDEVDKITGKVGGKPNITGVTIQQSLLTLMEGENILYETAVLKDGEYKTIALSIETKYMLFICGGAFENLYDLVHFRVFTENKERVPTKTIVNKDGTITFKQVFTLKDFLRQDDLFEYGILPQFLSRFDNAIVLGDLDSEILRNILIAQREDSIYSTSKSFFKKFDIDLILTPDAQDLIAGEASNHTRVGARALRDVYGRVIKQFEFDPFTKEELRKTDHGFELVIDEKIVKRALGIK